MLVIEMMDSFLMKYQSILRQITLRELRTLVEQIEQNKDATMTSETVENFVKQLQGAKGSYWKILALQNYGYNIFIT